MTSGEGGGEKSNKISNLEEKSNKQSRREITVL